MLKVREILRLKHEVQLSLREIGQACNERVLSYASSVPLASFNACIVASTTCNFFSSSELSITSMRFPQLLAAFLDGKKYFCNAVVEDVEYHDFNSRKTSGTVFYYTNLNVPCY